MSRRAINCILLLVLLFATACNERNVDKYQEQDRRFRATYKAVLAGVDSMLKKDQQIRYYLIYGTTDVHVVDSLEQYAEDRHIDLDSLDKKINLSGLSQAQKDSIGIVMTAMGKTHTMRMIALINEYGYPTDARVDTSLHIAPDLLLEHGDWSYKDTVMKLLTEELRLKRMNSSSYEFIRWNMNGRIGFPMVPGVTIMHKNADGKVDTIQKGE